MQVFIASDHRGFSLKNKLVTDIAHTSLGLPFEVSVVDLGPSTYDVKDDFNDAAINVSRAILSSPKAKALEDKTFGILICGSAIGISIQANRFKGIRAAVVTDLETAESSRQHNDANIICLAADRLSGAKDPLETETAYENLVAIIQTFLKTPFLDKECYTRRNKRLDKEV